ncbi:hypothetical protein VP01_1884g1 [Puccinia sorghi]|uniref:Uncharacterized protein n=1 Tax=Puccinia sorghi TaxID=27349 RepID=A0A0L6VCZ4_9BASI|nr:hypothetical protein VP01_1884g1 [Puccinia sorghi]
MTSLPRIRKAVELLQGLDRVPRIGTLTMFLEPNHQKGPLPTLKIVEAKAIADFAFTPVAVIREILITFQNLEPGNYVRFDAMNGLRSSRTEQEKSRERNYLNLGQSTLIIPQGRGKIRLIIRHSFLFRELGIFLCEKKGQRKYLVKIDVCGSL